MQEAIKEAQNEIIVSKESIEKLSHELDEAREKDLYISNL